MPSSLPVVGPSALAVPRSCAPVFPGLGPEVSGVGSRWETDREANSWAAADSVVQKSREQSILKQLQSELPPEGLS